MTSIMNTIMRWFAHVGRCINGVWRRIREYVVRLFCLRSSTKDSVQGVSIVAANTSEKTKIPAVTNSKIRNKSLAKNITTDNIKTNPKPPAIKSKKKKKSSSEKSKVNSIKKKPLSTKCNIKNKKKSEAQTKPISNIENNIPIPTVENKNETSSEPPPRNSSGEQPILRDHNNNKKKIIRISLLSNKNVKLNTAKNPWVPTVAKRKAVMTAEATTNVDTMTTKEVEKTIRSILNKITSENIKILTKDFLNLPIDTMNQLQNAVDLIYEKMIEDQNFVSLYAALCSAIQSIQVANDKITNKTFKWLIIYKCNLEFILNEKLINEYTFKRSLGNFRFIGELYKEQIFTVKHIVFCIVHLIRKESEESIEYLCNLLKIIGKKVEEVKDFNDIFSKLNELASDKNRFSQRIRFMIMDIIDLWTNNWLPKHLDYKPVVNNTVQRVNSAAAAGVHVSVQVKQHACGNSGQNVPPLKSNKPVGDVLMKNNCTKQNKQNVLRPTDMEDKIHNLCYNIITKYEKLNNLDDVIYYLVHDKKSCIQSKHKEFVTSTILITLDKSAKSRTKAGMMFAELLCKKALSLTDITQGIITVLKKWNDYHYYFSYVAAVVEPLLTSKVGLFDFSNLKRICSSIGSGKSSVFFVEVLKTIVQSKENYTENKFDDVLKMYKMWTAEVKFMLLEMFIPDNQINTFFKNDQLGILLLSMAMFDKTKVIKDKNSLYKITHKWIKKNIDIETVRHPSFVWSLTIATIIVCSNNPKDVEFFDRDRGMLIKNYIDSTCDFSAIEIRMRRLQCAYACREISAAIQQEQEFEDMEIRLLDKLFRIQAISMDLIDP